MFVFKNPIASWKVDDKCWQDTNLSRTYCWWMEKCGEIASFQETKNLEYICI